MKKTNQKKRYISEEEWEKCRKVAKAFQELYEEEDILVLDAGSYGFVKLQHYSPPEFAVNEVFTASRCLFEHLWLEWLHIQLFHFAEGTQLLDLEYEEIWERLPETKQKELAEKKGYFEKLAGLDL